MPGLRRTIEVGDYVRWERGPIAPWNWVEGEVVEISNMVRVEMTKQRLSCSLDELLDELYAASSHSDRSRIAPALDRMLVCVDHWRLSSPGTIADLFERLDLSRVVRAVGQTLIASTRLYGDRSKTRQGFVSRFQQTYAGQPKDQA